MGGVIYETQMNVLFILRSNLNIAHYRYTNIPTPTIAPCLKVFWAQIFWISDFILYLTQDHFYFRAIGKWTFCVWMYMARRTRPSCLYSRCSVNCIIYPTSLETKKKGLPNLFIYACMHVCVRAVGTHVLIACMAAHVAARRGCRNSQSGLYW